MPHVFWVIRAQRALERAISPRVPAALRAAVYRRISEILARTFHDCAAVLVRRRLQGYRKHYSWVAATRGEVELLQARSKEAAGYYCQAAAPLSQRDRRSSRRQAELIARHSPEEVRNSWTPVRFDEVFGQDTRQEQAQAAEN
jgi:hypothetical protein